MSLSDLKEQARRLRDANGWGSRKIGEALGIGKDAALRLLRKLEFEEAKSREPAAVSVMEIEPQTAPEFAERITQCWRKSVDAIFEVGRLLTRAKDTLPHGEFLSMVKDALPFQEDTAQRLMKVAADQRLSKAAHARYLPASWMTLYELTKLPDDAFEARIADGTIRPDMERKDVASTVKRERRENRERVLAGMIEAGNLHLPQKRYGVILADPEWRFEPRSRETGMDRAPDNHYATSPTPVIAARPVADIAAKDCVLFLWATIPMLPDALTVMTSWGFEYKSHRAWDKRPHVGPGYWFREQHELLLVGTRGNVPCPAPGDNWSSIQDAPVGRHSAKPDWQYELIESYFPHLPKIELNARASREGWDSWGAEAPDKSEAAE